MGELAKAAAAVVKAAALDLQLEGAFLYIDNGAAEALESALGLEALFELGVAGVCDLEAASPADVAAASLLAGAPVHRVVLAITSLLHAAEALLLAACAAAQQAAQFTVCCALSEAAHHDEQPSIYSPACFADAAARMQQQLNAGRLAVGAGPCSVAVQHLPLLVCPVTPAAFVLPAGSAAAALPRLGPWPAGWDTALPRGAGSDSDDEGGPQQASAARRRASGPAAGQQAAPAATGGGTAGLALLAHVLTQAAAQLDLRLEAFSCGPTAAAVAKHLAFVPPAAAPGGAEPSETAALVLVDRACDLLTPALHPDHLLARIVGVLPLLPASLGGSGPAGVSPALLGAPAPHWQPEGEAAAAAEGAAAAPPAPPAAPAGAGEAPPPLLPGGLCAAGDPRMAQWLAFLMSRRGKDGPLFVRKWLREVLRKEGVPPKPHHRFKAGSTSAAELADLASLLAAHSPAAAARQHPLTTLAGAAAAALGGDAAAAWEAASREERQLLLACSEGSSDDAAAQLCELCALAARPGGGSPLAAEDVALLILAAHLLLPEFLPWYAEGAFDARQSAALQEALAQALAAGGGRGLAHGAAQQQEERRRPQAGQEEAAAEGWEDELPDLWLGSPQVPAAPGPGAPRAPTAEQAAGLAAGFLEHCRQLAVLRKRQLGKELGRLTAPVAGGEGGEAGAPQPRSLLAQLAERALSGQAVPQLQHAATSLAGLLKSVGGRFGLLHKQPAPGDYHTILFFVVGGVSVQELHELAAVADAAAAAAAAGNDDERGAGAGPRARRQGQGQQRGPHRVLVGSTGLLRPRDVARGLLAASWS
eukprot:scaffold19.g1780.t1